MRTRRMVADRKTWGLLGVMLGLVLLGTGGESFAAVWEGGCQKAIEQLEQSQHHISVKHQEIETAKLAILLPQGTLFNSEVSQKDREDKYSELVNELKSQFRDFQLHLSVFGQACLGSKNS